MLYSGITFAEPGLYITLRQYHRLIHGPLPFQKVYEKLNNRDVFRSSLFFLLLSLSKAN